MPQDVLPSVVTKKAGRNFPRPPFTVTKPQRNGLRRLSPPPRPGHCDVDWVVHFYQFCYYFQNINRKIRECKSAEEFFRVCGRKKRNASVTTPAVHNCLFSRPGVQQISRLCGSLLPHLSRTLHFHIIPTTGQRQERNIPCGSKLPQPKRRQAAALPNAPSADTSGSINMAQRFPVAITYSLNPAKRHKYGVRAYGARQQAAAFSAGEEFPPAPSGICLSKRWS